MFFKGLLEIEVLENRVTTNARAFSYGESETPAAWTRRGVVEALKVKTLALKSTAFHAGKTSVGESGAHE